MTYSLLSGLRTRLLLLLLLALAPALGLTLNTTAEAQRAATNEVLTNALQLTQLAASSQGQLVARARQFLVTLSQLPEVRDGDQIVCNALLARLLEQHSLYANFGVAELDGDVFCSAVPASQPVNVADRLYFQRTVQTRDFAIGEYQIGRITGKATISFGYPVLDGAGQVQAVVGAALDLAEMNMLVADAQLPEGAALTVVDRNGTILARSPNPEQWVGQTVPDAPIIAAILSNQGAGTIEAAGVDGILRLYAFTPVSGVQEGSLYVSVGIPREVAFAQVNRIVIGYLAGLGLVAVLAFAALLFGSNLLILRPLNTLLGVTRRISADDLSARTRLAGGPTEVRQLARAFDDMAGALQQREAERQRAQQELAYSRQMLQLVMDNIPQSICWKDRASVYLGCNRRFALDLSLLSPEDVVGKTDYDLVSAAEAEHYRSIDRRVMETDTSELNFEEPQPRGSGIQAWLRTSKVPLHDEDGDVLGVLVMYEDITERKQAQERLRRQAERLKTLHAIDRAILTAQSSITVAQTALEFVVQQVLATRVSITLFNFATNEGTVFVAYSRHETQWPTGSTFSLDALPSEYFETLRKGTVQVIEDVATFPDIPAGIQALQAEGVRCYVRIPLMAQAELIGSFNLGADSPNAFTQEHLEIAHEIASQLAIAIQQGWLREQVQRQIVELEERVIERTGELSRTKEHVEAVLNSSSDAIVLTNSDGAIQQTNPAFSQLFGYKGDEAFLQPLSRLVEPACVEPLTEALAVVVGSHQTRRIEVLARHKMGSAFAADMAIAPIADADHQPPRIICSLRDITERKRMEEELRMALERERELNELKSRFSSMVSHEFRNPLASILSSSDLLKSYSHRMSEERKLEHLEQIQEQVKRLVGFLDEILLLSKAQTVGLEFNPVLLDLAALCRRIHDEIQQTAGETYQILFASSGECNEVAVDEKLLRQAITNLLTNAIKYSPEGGVVSVDLSCDETQVVIRVKDQGIGIPEEDQKHLFETFHRAQNVGEIPGTGLGLTIVKQAVEAHKGVLSFESSIGIGTTFTIQLSRA